MGEVTISCDRPTKKKEDAGSARMRWAEAILDGQDSQTGRKTGPYKVGGIAERTFREKKCRFSAEPIDMLVYMVLVPLGFLPNTLSRNINITDPSLLKILPRHGMRRQNTILC